MTFTREEIEEIASWVKSPTLEKVIDHIRAAYIETWMRSEAVAARENCWLMARLVDQVVNEMQAIVNEQKVDQFNARRTRANDWRMPTPEERI